jgi:hypothetical protein
MLDLPLNGRDFRSWPRWFRRHQPRLPDAGAQHGVNGARRQDRLHDQWGSVSSQYFDVASIVVLRCDSGIFGSVNSFSAENGQGIRSSA